MLPLFVIILLNVHRPTSRYQQAIVFKYIYIHTYEGRKEMFYLTTHSTHFIYGYMASGIW